MPKHYCPSCGAANEFSITAPKFCSQCSASFNVALGSAPAPVTTQQPARPKLVPYREDDNGFDEDNFPPTPNLRIPKKLDIEIEVDADPRQKIEHVIGSNLDANGKPLTTETFSRPKAAVDLNAWRNKLRQTQRHEVGGAGGNE